jgi:hypothetical protein
MNRIFLVLLILSTFLMSCDDEESAVKEKKDPLAGLPDEGPVHLDNPVIGQRSYYIRFRAFDKTDTEDIRFDYTTDTLVLAVTGNESGKWLLKEFITEGSTTLSSDTVFLLSLVVDSDSASFAGPSGGPYYSNFFGIPPGESLKFTMDLIAEPAIQNPTCSPFASRYSNDMEFALNYTQFSQTFDHLNIYQDYSATATDGPGLMYVYAPAHGFVRMTVFNPWVYNEVTGWDLIR